jgi:hypothetical protein
VADRIRQHALAPRPQPTWLPLRNILALRRSKKLKCAMRNWVALPLHGGALAFAVVMGACSGNDLLQNVTQPTSSDLPQPNHRRIIADNINTIFRNPASVTDLQISGTRLVDHVKGPTWLTCLKFQTRPNPVVVPSAPGSTATEEPAAPSPAPAPQYYAIFIQGDRIIDSRIGVAIDRCRDESFQPFDLSAPVAPKKS